MEVFSRQPLKPEGLSISVEWTAPTKNVGVVETGSLVFRCPTTAREIETGIDMDQGTFVSIRDLTVRLLCGWCRQLHEWSVGDGALEPFGACKKQEGMTIPAVTYGSIPKFLAPVVLVR